MADNTNQIQNTDNALWLANSNTGYDPYSSDDPNNSSKKGAVHVSQLPQFCWKDKEAFKGSPKRGKKK